MLESPFGTNDWSDLEKVLKTRLYRRWPLVGHEDICDATQVAMADLVMYWRHLPSSQNRNPKTAWNFANRRGWHKACEYLGALVKYQSVEMVSAPQKHGRDFINIETLEGAPTLSVGEYEFDVDDLIVSVSAEDYAIANVSWEAEMQNLTGDDRKAFAELYSGDAHYQSTMAHRSRSYVERKRRGVKNRFLSL